MSVSNTEIRNRQFIDEFLPTVASWYNEAKFVANAMKVSFCAYTLFIYARQKAAEINNEALCKHLDEVTSMCLNGIVAKEYVDLFIKNGDFNN